MPARFAFCTCQPGAEAALKREVEIRLAQWRFAFSRPGFVTFKLPTEIEVEEFEPPRLIFARTAGLSFARLEAAESIGDLAKQVWQEPEVQELAERGPSQLHVWERDSLLPGEEGFEPGPTELSRAALDAIQSAKGAYASMSEPIEGTSTTERKPAIAIDVVLVEPQQWWSGAHVIRSRTDRWPGGVPRLELPEHAVSRAYLKMQEGLRWAALPCTAGDQWVELGCAPGGASQALLDAGMWVTGIDPAEVDPLLLKHDRFRHVRTKSAEAPRRLLSGARWIAADLNVAPNYTLEAVETLLRDNRINPRGLLLTLKLLDWKLAEPERVSEYVKRVKSWGMSDVRVRQLAHNRREFCLAALKRRAQRRWTRRKGR